MKILFRLMMAIQVWLYRLTAGKVGGTIRGFNVLLLTTKGRKSGKTYTTPLGWFKHEDSYLIAATNAGFPKNPAWYYNLKSSRQVTVQILDKVMPVTAEVLSGEVRTQAWRQIVATTPSYAAYEKRTTREIPVILLRPNK